MANWTAAQKKAAARIFAQALPPLRTQKKSSLKPTPSVIDQFWDRSSYPKRSHSSIPLYQNDLAISDSDEESSTTTEDDDDDDEVLFCVTTRCLRVTNVVHVLRVP